MSAALPNILKTQIQAQSALLQDALDAEIMVRNDDTFPAEAAIMALHAVLPGCSVEDALRKAAEIHHSGVASVFAGAREVCELYADQLILHGVDAFVP